VEDLVRAGNQAFRNEQFNDALEQYQIAETELPESPELDYNIAGVLYQQGKYEETVERYGKALNSTDAALQPQALYNLGNTYYRMGDYQNAIVNFQKALEADPNDIDAKFNLELSRKMLKENLQPQQQDQDQQQQQQQEQQQNDQQQEQQQEEQQSEDQQQQDQQQEQQPQEQPKPEETEKISKEDAERILNALQDDEQDQQDKVKRQVRGGEYRGNDW
jgi:tetratricopeptide (TPR) repeat protein